MRSNYLKTLKTAVLAVTILLLGVSVSVAQQTVNLTAAPTTLTTPDGTVVPMWGYTCGTVVSTATATCAALNPASVATNTWSPIVITIPYVAATTTAPLGTTLTIALTNNLAFPSTSPTTFIPTSLMIVGQLGGGLGAAAAGNCTSGTTCTAPPDHSLSQQVTWPIAAPGVAAGTPPTQGYRVQSFGTEVAAGAPGTAVNLTWNNLRPGTYLIESGTHPSIQGPMGLFGMLVVTTPATTTVAGTAYPAVAATTTTAAVPAVTYNTEVPLLFSEIDPVQNKAVQAAVNTPGFLETNVWSGLPGGCGNPSSPTYHTCYPPAVNYTPLYYLINGVAFNKTSSSNSLFATSPATGVSATGTVLVRMVNAGVRMHVPSIVGSQTGVAVAPATVPPAGFSLIAEDGNPLPGVPRVQSEVFMAAGKTYDVMINVPAATVTGAVPVYDRQLSLASNSVGRDGGMLAYIAVNGATTLPSAATATAVARADTYNSLVAGQTLSVADPGKGVIANDTNVYGVQLLAQAANGTVTLNTDGTFTYVPTGTATSDSFTYCANGSVTGTACSGLTATVTLGGAPAEATGSLTCSVPTGTNYTSTVTSALSIKPPGVLAFCKDAAGYPITLTGVTPAAGLNLTFDPNGGFNATTVGSTTAAVPFTFTFNVQSARGTTLTGVGPVTILFPAATNLAVAVKDGKTGALIQDYRWVIEEDRTFYVNPNCTANPPAAGCPTAGSGIVATFGANFHTSFMPLVATGCTGPQSCEFGQTLQGANVVCDIGNGGCRTSASQQTVLMPGAVHLDPTKRYYISVLPGDAANPFEATNLSATCGSFTNLGGVTGNSCGHGMGGAAIACAPAPAATCTSFPAVTVLTQPTPFPPSKLSVFVFEDDFPLNGEQDGGGGIDVLSPNEPGLGTFNITLFDDAGGTGDATGQMTYDMFNQPLVNSLAGTIDPVTTLDACPVSVNSRQGVGDPTQTGITGTIVTCPKYESDNHTLSPLAGQAVVANLMPGRYGVVATPGADRIARGEEWLQTNTLDGQKAHDSFLRIGEPSFFQEYGPAGYHVSIGFANPQIINDRKAGVCGGTDPNISGTNCTNTVKGLVTTERMSRTPDERLYSSGTNDSFSFTQCYVSFGDADGEDFAFSKCNADGTFTLSGLPNGDWRITVFDQWNDMLVDGLSIPVRLAGGTTDLGQIAMNQWQANIYTSTFFDTNKNGVRDSTESGLTLVPTNNRFRDGSYSNFNNTDLSGNAGFNEIFPLFSWYVIETDTTRYKTTGVHVVYDAGGPADGTCTSATAPCGSSNIAMNMANTAEQVSVPTILRVPGAVYCKDADCSTHATGILGGPGSSDPPSSCTIATSGTTTCSTTLSTGRIDPPWVATEGWQGFSGQNSFIEFGKTPYAPGETGGIHGEVIYASTRPFDDPTLLIHTSWTPDVPGVTINLYQEDFAADGVTQVLHLVDTTKTSSWDDWAQGFRSDGNPNMNCPGQLGAPTTTAGGDLFFFTLYNQPMWLDMYNNGGTPAHTIPNNSQFKCFDGMHNWNQVQPAPYDGMYQFPSVAAINPTTGAVTSNCHTRTTAEPWGCVPNPDTTDAFRAGTPMLPPGKYVVEMIVPPGYELVKEEDKNILIGDNYIAPVTQEFPGLGGAIYILPDQAEVTNATNAQNSTVALGRTTLPSHEGDTGSVETFWPCVGLLRQVPDYISLFPQSHEVSPFAGAMRNLCDRKEVTLDEQTSALAKFWIFTSAHVAAHFTGVITDDFTSEFDPFSPQFGEKFSPANLPVSIKDWSGTEISRVYSDQWGSYDGLTYSTWEVNPPNPTGYAPTMMVTCMNDAGPIPGPGGTMITDPLYNPQYSQFCYEIPFMPGQTQYMDTPVVPTSAFAGAGYNNPDCAYPDATPAIAEVDGDAVSGNNLGPWVSAAGSGHTLTIHALAPSTTPGMQVQNYGYSGPSATTFPFNAKTIARHYGFGGAAGTVAVVGSDGVARPLTGVSWSDATITGTVPTGLPPCNIQQQAQYKPTGTTNALCGQLVITTPAGKQSIDTVTVTVGGKAPTHVAASASVQAAIDKANPGDLIIIDPTCTATSTTGVVTQGACTSAFPNHSTGSHNEVLIMWKPVRLQGVGAVSSVINANTHPAGKMDVWRRQINCLFGLAINGAAVNNTSNPYDPNGTFSCGGTTAAPWTGFKAYGGAGDVNPQVDRLPLEAAVGWDAGLNGNLAELLQEPSLMGALEGAGITVLGKGVKFPSDPYAASLLAGFPTGTTLLLGTPNSTGVFPVGDNNSNCHTSTGTSASAQANPFASNFQCNPSSIDGVTITNSSQGGGGIFVHGWAHNLQIANNRIQNNAGTLSGGINLGQGEFAPSYTGGAAAINSPPGSCQTSNTAIQLPYCEDMNVNVHHNLVVGNSSTGDELFSATPAGAGGVSICTGSDYYKFNYNWVCGNLSSGDGGGVGHLGFSYNGDIEHNSILFNQSTNPTIASNGGGMIIMGTPDADPTCGTTVDTDCVPPLGSVGPSDGVGPNLTINANLIMGNAAESGSGGGIAFQNVNGGEVVAFPTTPSRWYQINVTNNIITNNVAGWDGAGISLLDALNTNIINNTIMSNDTTASSGVLFNTLGAPLASTQGPCPPGQTDPATGLCRVQVTTSAPQPAGLVVQQNSATLVANLPATITCPANHFAGTTASNGTCRSFSYPELYNDVFYQNRAFNITVGSLGAGTLNQQNVVALVPTLNQATTGACPSTTNYWDIGVRGDTTAGAAATGNPRLAPRFSFLTSLTGYTGLNDSAANPAVVSQYCNGSRVPPENGGLGYNVPPGISDATVPNPIFNLTPAATVDEGNNWINIAWGPLSLVNPQTNVTLGNYAQAAGSPVINYVPSTGAGAPFYAAAPATDFFGNARKNGSVDAGAVEFTPGGVTSGAVLSVTGGPLSFGNAGVSTPATTSAPKQLTLHNTGTATGTGIALGFSLAQFSRPAGTAGGTCGATLAAGATCTINVVFSPNALGAFNGTLTITANVGVTGSPVILSGTGVAPVIAATLTPTSWAPTQTRNCPGTTLAQILACTLDPAQVFTLTNTGNVTLTGIGQGTLSGTNVADFSVVRLLSTCGPATGGQLLANTTLAPGATCAVTVQFKPLTSEAAGTKNAAISVTDAAGTQTSSLTGTAN